MRPTMLLTDGNLGPEAVVEQVRKVGIPVLVLAPGSTPDSAQLLMQRLGKEFHHEVQADSRSPRGSVRCRRCCATARSGQRGAGRACS